VPRNLCRVLLQETVASFATVTNQALAVMKHGPSSAAQRLSPSHSLLESVLLASKAFALLMKLMKSHDSNHLVFQAALRFGGKFVDLFLKVSATAVPSPLPISPFVRWMNFALCLCIAF
jgi:hypothetical protein